jgi:hypothetical protein
MVGWLVGWYVGWLVGCLAGWFVGWLAGWFVGWLAGLLVGSLVGWLAGWLAGWLVGWLVGWLAGLLVRWFIGSLYVHMYKCEFSFVNDYKDHRFVYKVSTSVVSWNQKNNTWRIPANKKSITCGLMRTGLICKVLLLNKH